MFVAEGNIKDDLSIECGKCYPGRTKGGMEAQMRASGLVSGKLRPKAEEGLTWYKMGGEREQAEDSSSRGNQWIYYY